MIKILLIDDDEDDYIITKDLITEIKNIDIELSWVQDYQKGIDAICEDVHDVYLVDYYLGNKTGINLIEEAIRIGCKAPLILLTGQGHFEIDYEAMKVGAADYLVKGKIDPSNLERSIRYALRHTSAMSQLEEKEQKYRSLFDKSIDAIYVIDTEKYFVDGNPTLLELLGYSVQELANLQLKDIFTDRSDYLKFTEELAGQNRLRNFETTLVKKNGKTFPCQLNSSRLTDGQENIIGYQGIIRDVSEQKRAEREVLMAEKLSTTGKIARSIAHEIRNPLTNLNLALEELRSEITGPNDSTDLYIGIIQRNSNRIEQLISELLNSSKPRQLDLQEVSINQVLELSLELVVDRLKLRGMILQKSLQPNLPYLKLDVEKIKVAFSNVLINAIEAMEDNEGKLQVSSQLQEGDIVVAITDNGEGIRSDDLEKLFDPFFTSKQGGMGLGLTSTKNIFNSHQARLKVESEIGKGTTFRICFPLPNA